MKQDLDQLLQEREIDAAVVVGGAHNNPAMYYMTHGAAISGGILIKPRGRAPVLIHHAMERDEAVKSGLATMSMSDLDYAGLRMASENALAADVKLYRKIFQTLDVHGRVAFYGMGERGASYVLLRALDDALEDVTLTGEYENDIFDVARATKDADEIARMRRAGQATSTIMRETMDFIQGHQVVRRSQAGSDVETLVKQDGTPLTIGDVKRFVRGRLFLYALEDPEGMIFSTGRDAGVPHSKGKADAALHLGQSIVFDLFPREMGGGYFHDMTRTFCLGYAPPEVKKAYQDVKTCFEQVVAALEPGAPTRRYEALTCDIFESQGHNTHRVDRSKQNGYVHSLGHGTGLKIHGRPRFGLMDSNQDTLQPGAVFTIEPGLYYPEQGFGVRLEDTFYLDEDGQFHSLTDLEKTLVLEM
jgi:Xaa-Pro aminopeptidase